MSIRSTRWPAGIPCWADLATSDFDGARTSYGEAFGWEIPDGNPLLGGYTNATRDGHLAVGLTPTTSPGQPSAWTVYLASDDIEATAAAITDNGGAITYGPMEVPGIVKVLVATDPQGGRFGVNEAISHIGAQITGEPGGIAWEHCVQPRAEAGKMFYSAVFGWVFEPIPGTEEGFVFSGRAGEPPYGSFGRMGPEFPTGWQVTFSAESADTVVQIFEAAGGTTVLPAHDSPWGRMAMISDATGAVFSVMETAGRPEPDRG